MWDTGTNNNGPTMSQQMAHRSTTHNTNKGGGRGQGKECVKEGQQTNDTGPCDALPVSPMGITNVLLLLHACT